MKFKIIPNEQTPKIEQCSSPEKLIFESNKLLEKFLSFARRQHNCVGLAANQVSLNGERIMEHFFAIKKNNIWDIIVLPKIIQYDGMSGIEIESCLTWLGKKIEAKRHHSIIVDYFTLKNEIKRRHIINYEAQIWQHECDHLNGIEENIICGGV